MQSTVTFTLAAGVENLMLNGGAAISGAGNALVNAIAGNGASNALSGLGGNDTVNGHGGQTGSTAAPCRRPGGGNGNDTYVSTIQATRQARHPVAAPTLVQSSVTFTLAGEVEILALTGSGRRSTAQATGSPTR